MKTLPKGIEPSKLSSIEDSISLLPPKQSSLVDQLLDQPRHPVSPFSLDSGTRRTEYHRLNPNHQRFITVLEQIAYIENIGKPGVTYQGGGKGVRPLARLIGIPQPSLRDYLTGNVSDPSGISSEYFDKIARARRVSPYALRCMIKGEEIKCSPEDLLASAWTANLSDLLPVLEVINYRMLAQLGIHYQLPSSVYNIPLKQYEGQQEDYIRRLQANLPIDLSKLREVREGADADPEEQEQLEIEEVLKPYEGNLKLFSKLQARLDELNAVGITPDQAMNLYSLTPEMLEEMETSTEPIPDEWVAGPLMRALNMTTEELLIIRDGESGKPSKAVVEETTKVNQPKKNPTKVSRIRK
jgi:hypothetical protein